MAKIVSTNREVADVLREISLFLEAEGVAFKPQAYAWAAEVVEALGEDIGTMYERCGTECLDALPGIGESIAGKIAELVTTGRMAYRDGLRKRHPFDIVGLTRIQEIGAKTALALYRKLGIKSVDDLERAARDGRIRTIPGFGRKREELILKGLGFLRGHAGRFRLHDALPAAEAIVTKLSKVPGVAHCDAAGSIRRRQETIGDIDLLLTSAKPAAAIAAFKALPEIEEIAEEGPTRLAVRYRMGMGGDLRVLRPNEYGSALLYFTGDKRHNILLRERAASMGMKLSEYGLFRGKTRVACETEEDVYARLGLDWIPPELRTASGEIEAAESGSLPDLLPYGSLRGDLQVQTDWSDGSASIAQMAEAGRASGLSYVAITDHTKSLAMANGLSEKRLREQGREIDALNKRIRGFRVLKSAECDVRKDGSLDLSDSALRSLDLVCVAVHTYFGLDENAQTERVIRAMRHPLVSVLLHPTGRIVNAREPYAIDMPRIVRAAKEYRVALEVNGSERLDLRDAHVRMAVDAGAKLVVNSDAHRPEDFANLAYGVATARRGWAERSDVLNARPVGVLLRALRKPR